MNSWTQHGDLKLFQNRHNSMNLNDSLLCVSCVIYVCIEYMDEAKVVCPSRLLKSKAKYFNNLLIREVLLILYFQDILQ